MIRCRDGQCTPARQMKLVRLERGNVPQFLDIFDAHRGRIPPPLRGFNLYAAVRDSSTTPLISSLHRLCPEEQRAAPALVHPDRKSVAEGQGVGLGGRR